MVKPAKQPKGSPGGMGKGMGGTGSKFPGNKAFSMSDTPFGHATEGKPNRHAQPIGTGASPRAPRSDASDGAGRSGHDEAGYNAYSERKGGGGGSHAAGSHTVGYQPKTEGGAYGYPGDHLRLGGDPHLVGEASTKASNQTSSIPMGKPGQMGYPGGQTGLTYKPHGYGHTGSQRQGVLRNSGHSGAHRIGKR